MLGDSPRASVCVLFPVPVHTPYSYEIIDDIAPEPGQFVRAPIGGREAIGVVWPGALEIEGAKAPKLKSLTEVLDVPPLSHDLIDFVEWAAKYTMAPLGNVLRLVMRKGDVVTPPANMRGLFLAGEMTGAPLELRSEKQRAVIGAAMQQSGQSAAALARAAGVSPSSVAALKKEGVLIERAVDPDLPFDVPDLQLKGKALSDDQARAVKLINGHIDERAHATILIDGVTGSGKTEVYLEALAHALAKDERAQALILLPEISLTLPFLARVEARFNAPPAPWHSELGVAARRRSWRRVVDGSARIVVGARSALFLPFQNLKLIIVDEEHEGGYKQEEGVLYHARDMAVARGARARFPVILASATPSLETVVNVDHGRFEAAALRSRFSGAKLPDISLIDMRSNAPEKERWLSQQAVDEIERNITRKEQSLLFLNRRGYAPLTICRKCGHRMTAPGSDTMLVEHRAQNRLVCHHTGFSMPKPKNCPSCGAHDSLAACGPGVERLYEEACARWPGKNIRVLSSDSVANPQEMRKLLDEMEAGEIDILIATQVVAKGHHFPNLTLVTVVDADLGLSGGDLRAAERTFSLLSQVAGRAGRAEKEGRVLLQTYQPHAPVMQALRANDRDAFLIAEAEGRHRLGFPPFGRLASILMRGEDEKALHAAAQTLLNCAPNGEGIEIFGPARAPLYRLRGQYRMRLLVKGKLDGQSSGLYSLIGLAA